MVDVFRTYNAFVLRSDYQRDDGKFGEFLELLHVALVAEDPFVRDALVSRVAPYFDGVWAVRAAEDAVRHRAGGICVLKRIRLDWV